MNAANPSRPQLKIRRVNLDTGRENVVVISRRSMALRPEVFRGFSRVELRRNSKVLLATLLLPTTGWSGPMNSASPNRPSTVLPSLSAATSPSHRPPHPTASMRCGPKSEAAR